MAINLKLMASDGNKLPLIVIYLFLNGNLRGMKG
jgi:hypothetical protein